jgi:ABC-type transport system involved in multi-copper enzyme maturation permease subunit
MTSTTMTRPVRIADAPSQWASLPGIPFSRLLRVEWAKATGTRSARWLLLLVAASTVGLMLAPILAHSSIDQTYTSYLGFAAIGLTILLPVVSILTLTSEWSQRTVLTTFTQEPRRARVINAKVAVSLLLAGGAAVFGGLVTAAGLAVAAASGRELDANLNAGVLVGYLLFVLLNVLTGVAFGALLHNSAAAIVLYFALPTAFALLGRALTSLAQWIDSSTTFDWILQGEWSGHTPQILVSVAVWVAVPLAAGLFRTVRREIN